LVRLDLPTLEPVAGLDPIPIARDTWSVASPDGSLLIVFEWDEKAQVNQGRTIDVELWREVGALQLGPMSGLMIHEGEAYTLDHQGGQLTGTDLLTGDESALADWSPNHLLYEGPILLPGPRIAALVGKPVATGEIAPFSVAIFDTRTGESFQVPVGPLERVNPETGFFDGEYEIPETDYPGVAWDDGRLLLAYMDGPEVIEVDFATGEIESHLIELSSWWTRMWASWMPAASAKGPSLGTYSSAALSEDGRYLFMSGNKQVITVAADGTLGEDSEHLGLLAVDTETWRPMATPDLPIQFVRVIEGGAIGVDTTSFHPWTDDYYLLSIDRAGVLDVRGPVEVPGGSCEQSSDGRYLLCTQDSTSKVRVIDMETLETVAERSIGHQDALLSNGVLVDSLPRSDP
jgi:hypothetical protein